MKLPDRLRPEVEWVVWKYWTRIFEISKCERCGSPSEPEFVRICLQPYLTCENRQVEVKIVSVYGAHLHKSCWIYGYNKITAGDERKWGSDFRKELVSSIELPKSKPSYLSYLLDTWPTETQWSTIIYPPNSHQMFLAASGEDPRCEKQKGKGE